MNPSIPHLRPPRSSESRLRRARDRRLLPALLAWAATGALPAPMHAATRARGTCDHVLIISVDGLRSDALLDASSLPAFKRLLAGSSTLNARTDPEWTTTMPNHVGMVTGRLTGGESGHRWVINTDVPREHVVHQSDRYVAGMFDVAHDCGVFTAILAGKVKFSLLDASWDNTHGAIDRTGPDNGRDKVDAYEYVEWTEAAPSHQSNRLTELALNVLGGNHKQTLTLLLYAAPDIAGHTSGWDLTTGSAYLASLDEVDKQIAQLLDFIERHPATKGRCAVILTSDHGGGAPLHHHDRIEMWVNYIIPFVVWRGGAPGGDLYRLNPSTRRDPSLWQPNGERAPPPIRNSDAANVALDLLGLPPVPGSTVNAAQDLESQAEKGE